MAIRRVLLFGALRQKYTKVDDEATKGATIGKDVLNADGTLYDPSAPTTTPGGGSSTTPAITVTIWRFIREIPANIVSLAALSTIGFATRISAGGAWATRVITGTAGRITVADGDGVAANPVIDLATLTDDTTGTLKAITRDAWGRLQGTRDADSYDMPQFPVIRENMNPSESFTIQAGYQMLVYNNFGAHGDLIVEGDLVVL